MSRLTHRTFLQLWRIFAALTVVFALGVLSSDGGVAQRAPHAVRLIVNGPIGPAVADYIHRGLAKAVDGGATVVIMQMDTPGGLDTSMREIIKDILASPIPVIGYVAPSGARAASAGTYILYASHVAAMAPATNLGAATPVQLGGPNKPEQPPGKQPESQPAKETGNSGKTDSGTNAKGGNDKGAEKPAQDSQPFTGKPGMEQKVLNDAVAYIRSLAQKRGRNAEWAVKAVKEAASLSASDALQIKVIDFIADSPAQALEKADGMRVDVNGTEEVMKTAGLPVVDMAPDWRVELLEAITDPTVAYLLLFTIGVPALLLEFYTGTMIAGVVGAICIVLGLYGLHMLPINYAGAGLILLGLALLVAEMFVPSFGALGLGGVASFVIGSVMLIETDVPGYGISPWAIGAIATAAGAIMLLIIAVIIRSRSKAPVSGREAMVGAPGIVVDWSRDKGHVRFQGEVWQAMSDRSGLKKGVPVRIVDRAGLVLVVEPAPEELEDS